MKQIENYNHKLTEKKWQKFWADNDTFRFDINDKREKFYVLSMFLYPSGEMHLGHLRNFSIDDVVARFKRLQGYNVLHPTAADAFGLPAENAAIKRGIHPREWTYKNIDRIIKSMLSCGLSFDMSRIFATCDPEYYGFQQKIFIDLYKHGLAYQKESFVNWDPVDQTVLANEQVINGRGWRSDAIVEKKKLRQWFLKITKYADELLDCIKNGNLKGWPEKVRLMQENWIGKSEGATVRFNIVASLCKGGVCVADGGLTTALCNGGSCEATGGLTATLCKGGADEVSGGLTNRYLPYNKDLTKKAQELRKNQTPLEKKFWYEVLSNKNFKNLKWTRQKPIDNYIVDFFCNELMMAIELDGDTHASQVKYDKDRTKKLNELGIEVVRYNNRDIQNNLEGVYLDLEEKVEKRIEELKCQPPADFVSTPLTKGGGDGIDFVSTSITNGDEGQTYDFIEVYTTRPDTLFGASFVGISPNHPIAEELAKNNKEIADFIEECKKAPVDEESLETMEKKGIPTGLFVEHPFDKNWKLPVWIANFILMDYGTGAIFACPAHDQRDYDFAKKYDLPIRPVVAPENETFATSITPHLSSTQTSEAFTNSITSPLGLSQTSKVSTTPITPPLRGSQTDEIGLVGGYKKLYSQKALDYAKELRNNTTDAEKLLWYYLKDRQMLDVKFRRQAPIGDYIVDFVSFEIKLVIELDGGQHNEDKSAKYDEKRTKFLEDNGFKVIRFWDNDIFKNMDGVLETIYDTIKTIAPHQTNSVRLTPPQGGSDGVGQNSVGLTPHQGGSSGMGENCKQSSNLFSSPSRRERLGADENNFQLPYTEEGIAINSDFLNGLPTKEAKQKAIEKIEELGIGERKINYRLRDWGVSRQRYWGCPIPMVYCEDCGVVPEKEENLPIKLPEDVVFDGKGNPLANHPTWKYTTCPKCGKPAIRETDTMDTFVDSSWYFMRFVDLDKKNPVNKELCNKILPVDQYVGGIEHATMHLIYSRFFTKVMADMGYFDKSIREPAKRLFNQGMVCHKAYRNGKKEWCYPWNVREENGKYFDINTGEELKCEGIIKMSKSKCNVVDINTIIEDYGADAARLFVLSDTPADKDFEWTTEGIEGSWKYINRIWKLGAGFVEENDIDHLKNIKITKVNDLLKENHRAIKAVSNFLDNLEFNKAIARIRELSNTIEKTEIKDEEDLAIKYLAIKNLVKLLSPFTPHLCEELNQLLGEEKTLDKSNWPTFDEALTVDNEITVVIQVNGKLRGELTVKKDLPKEEIEELAKNQENVKKHLEGKEIKKTIVVPNKLVNFVVG